MHRLRIIAAAGAVLAAATALVAAPQAGARTLPSAAVPRLGWHRCPPSGERRFQCATARVPLSYRRPRGRTITLAVIRHRATDPSRRIGTLFYSPGGPAAAKPLLPHVLGVLPSAWIRRFDILTWDPRGLGQSSPVRCFDSTAAENRFLAGVGKPALSFPVGATQRARWIGRWAAFGRRCGQRNGALLRHVSTADTARDMDLLRRAIGQPRLTYLGGSWGTFLGATYANLFPRRIRAMVLASALDPDQWVGTGRRSGASALAPTYVRQGTARGARMTLDGFLDLCGRASTARCAFSAGSAGATRAKLSALLRRLPRRGPAGSATYADVVGWIANELYVASGWDQLARRLQELWTTGSAGPLSDEFPNLAGALAINCSDSPNPGPAAFSNAAAAAYRRQGAVGSLWTWATEPCSTWPATATDRYTGPWNRRTAHPILVVGNTSDPATPYHAAVALTRELGRARLLTVEGYGHGAPSPCADRVISRYLLRQSLPRRGTRCPSRPPLRGAG
jgi:pimeloyl-ACP methyl ester carboxylesterase